MSTTTTVRITDFPRVNLLPGEIAEEQKFRSLRAILALAVVAAVASVGGLWYLANQSVSDAQTELATATATQATLQTEVVKYAEVPAVYARVDAAQADLALAMGGEIRFSFVLNDLSLTIPDGVWLDSLNVTPNVENTTPNSATALGYPANGLLTFEGHGYKHNDTAAWLDSLTKSSYYSDPYFSQSTLDGKINNKSVVKFSSTVSLNEDAYSHRYSAKTGG